MVVQSSPTVLHGGEGAERNGRVGDKVEREGERVVVVQGPHVQS